MRTILTAMALAVVACVLLPRNAAAQYSVAQCTSVNNATTKAINQRDYKKWIALEREDLAYCTAYMEGNQYLNELSGLATALNGDNQHEEAIGVANNCLRINGNDIPCLLEKAKALWRLGRSAEAKSVVEKSLSLGAITDLDVAAKGELQRLDQLLSVRPASVVPSSLPNRAEVPLKRDRGTFVIPVQINGAITLDFTLDSGASDVSVPADVFSTLRRTGTIKDEDISNEQTYVLADGSKTKSATFTIRSLRVGDKVVENVRGSVTSAEGTPLLGQSFLERFKSWSIDNAKHELVLELQ